MSRDLKVGEKYNKFHNHIQINFDCTGNHKRPISRYRLREDNDVMDELSDKLTIFKIDIPYKNDITHKIILIIKNTFFITIVYHNN